MSKSYRNRNLRYEDTKSMSRKKLEQAYRSVSFNARRAIREIKAVYPKAIEVREYKKDFKTLKKLGELTDEQLRKEMLRASNFLHSQFGSLESYAEYRRKSIETLAWRGITEENFDEFSAFMKKRKDEGLLNIVPSDFWEMASDVGRDKQFYDRVKTLQDMLNQGLIEKTTAEENVRHWIRQTQSEAYREGSFDRYYISKRRKSG